MQSFIKKHRLLGIWIIGIFALFAVVKSQLPDTPLSTGASAPASAPTPAKKQEVVRVNAPTTGCSTEVRIPFGYTFKVEPEGKVLATRNRGKNPDIEDDELALTKYGDPVSSLCFRSKDGKEVGVKIVMWPT